MKHLIALAIALTVTGCRIVSTDIVIREVTNSTISTETLQDQDATKKLGDIAPNTSVVPK